MKNKHWLKRSLNKLMYYFQRGSLQTMLSVVFTLVSVVAIVIVSLNYSHKFSRSTEQLMATNSVNVLDQVNLNLENYLHDMMGVSNTAYYNIIKKLDIEKDKAEYQEKLEFLYKSSGKSIRNIAVFKLDGSLVANYPVREVNKEIEVTEAGWFISAVHQIENMHFSTPYVENIFYSETDPYQWIVTLSRSVDLTENGVVKPGVLTINMEISEIEKIAKSVNISENGYIYIIDSEGQFIYHPHQQLIASNLMTEENQRMSQFEEGTHIYGKKDNKQQVTVKNMGYSGWKIIAVSPESDYLEIYQVNRNYLIVSMILASIALLVFNVLASFKVTTPIKNLEKAVLKIEQDINNCDIPTEGTSEVRQLAKTLISMTDTLRRLMNNVVKEERDKRKTEMIALQSQINPHFLYNTLDSTVWMIESERYEGAITMITSLAHFFRISLSKGENVISLEDELSHVKSYLEIQKIRYKNKFNYHIDLDESIKDAKTVKLIVQPIVENAIYHAIDFVLDESMISIFAIYDDSQVVIKVEDNGPGMTEEQLSDIRRGVRKSNRKNKGSGIGLSNVDERVKLLFGSEYGLSIESEPDEGTIVTIKFPYEKLITESVKKNE